MALVPYRVSGAAADQRADVRLLQLPGGITLRLAQRSGLSGAADTGGADGRSYQAAGLPSAAAGSHAVRHAAAGITGGGGGSVVAESIAGASPLPAAASSTGAAEAMEWSGPPLSSLSNVGLVVWQAGFLLADYLLRRPPFGDPWADPAAAWRPLTVVDLGTGSGVVGIALALAGARVFLTDLPHVLPLARENVAANCDPRVTRATVCAYRWGDDPAAASAPQQDFPAGSPYRGVQAGASAGLCALAEAHGPPPLQPSPSSPLAGVAPDLITAADVLYHPELLPPLLAAIVRLSAPHTLTYVSYRVRHGGEVAAFARLAEAAGFAVTEVPGAELHEEYRGASGGGGGCGDWGMRGAASESDDDDEMVAARAGDPEGLSGVGELRRVGSYGILRLCRRDSAAPCEGGL